MNGRVTCSPAETEAAGRELAARLGPRRLVALCGGLGAGKTVFVRGLARGLGYTGPVTSPTFAIVNEYRQNGRVVLYHFDLCRIGPDDLEDVGWYEALASGVPVAAEWSENAPEATAGAVTVTLSGSGDEPRVLTESFPPEEMNP